MTTYTHLAITMTHSRGTHTEHWTEPRVTARNILAEYIRSHGLRRDAYSDSEKLFRGNFHVGHYTLTSA